MSDASKLECMVTYRTEADMIAARIRQVEVNVRIQRVDGVTDAAELECDVHLLVARELPHLAAQFRAGDELCTRDIFVEGLRYRAALG